MVKNKKEKLFDDNAYILEKELSKLPKEISEKIKKKELIIKDFINKVLEKSNEKCMGFYVSPEIDSKDPSKKPNFEKLKLHFLFDDFEKPISYFDYKLFLESEFDKLLEEKTSKQEGEEVKTYFLKSDKNIEFIASSISIVRENCFDAIYDDLRNLSYSIIIYDTRGFISALKSVDIHRNMLLQKFEKYVVAYVGAGSWLRGEKSNDFDAFVVVDDTDVKKMPRYQVKAQLTNIILDMARQVASLTGIHIHVQVYLLTDFWDAVKDAHPVMFTFLRDGVPFYDRGMYSAWKELLKLGKIKPSAEAIDMHMNVGTQLIDRAKKMFTEIFMQDVYNAVLSPSQAIIMLKGFNPTTPKETVKLIKDVLYEKEKSVTKTEYELLESTVKKFKEIEHNKEVKMTGTELDKFLKGAEAYLEKMKKMFEEISNEKSKDSINSYYTELLSQIKTLNGFETKKEKEIFQDFEKEYISSGKLPTFVLKSFNNFLKVHKNIANVSSTEINKATKDARIIMTEIKLFKERNIINNVKEKKLVVNFSENEFAEVYCHNSKIFLLHNNDFYEFYQDKFVNSKSNKDILQEISKLSKVEVNEQLITAIKKLLKTNKLFF